MQPRIGAPTADVAPTDSGRRQADDQRRRALRRSRRPLRLLCFDKEEGPPVFFSPGGFCKKQHQRATLRSADRSTRGCTRQIRHTVTVESRPVVFSDRSDRILKYSDQTEFCAQVQ